MKKIELIPGEMENEIEKDILSYLSFPELKVAVGCSRTWHDTIMGDKDLQKKVFGQDTKAQKKCYKILLNAVRDDPLDLEKIRRLLYIGVDFNQRYKMGELKTSTGESYAPNVLCFAASVKLANKQDKKLVRLLLNYKATFTSDDLLYVDRGMFYPDNKRNRFFENPFSPYYAHFSHPTIMALLYSTRFENECAKLQQDGVSNIAPYVFLAEAQQFDPTFVEEYVELLRSTSARHPFQGIQENLELNTINQIIGTTEFKQLSQNLSQRRFSINMWIVVFALICYLLIEAYKPGLGINYTEKIMMVGLLFLALLKGEKAHLRFTFEKLPTEESKAYPMKEAGLFLNRKDRTCNLTDEKKFNLNNSSSFTK